MTGPEIADRQGILDVAAGFQPSRALLTAFDLGLFTALGNGSMESGEVAIRIGADHRATDRLMNALVAVGLLKKDGDRFANTEAGLNHLVEGTQGYLGSLGHTSNTYKNWGTLTEAVKNGGTVIDLNWDSDDRRKAFIEAMHSRARNTADKLVSRLDLRGTRRVLDIGGGSGVYSMAFCRAGQGVSAVVFDLPRITELTRQYVKQAGMDHCVSTVDGDYHTGDFGDNFDLVFLSAIVHINSPEENVQLIKGSAKALNPGGMVVVQDFVMAEDRTSPAHGALFALNMLVNTTSGDSYTEEEISGWLTGAGLERIERIKTGPATAMIVGRKPVQ